MLQRLLTRSFGPLEAETLERLHTASLQELETWAEAILDATSLEEVFRTKQPHRKLRLPAQKHQTTASAVLHTV